MNHTSADKRVLAIDPTTKGFGFAVLEGPDRLVDWGTRETRGDRHTGCLQLAAELMDRYGTDAVVTEDPDGEGTRRCRRVRQLIRAIGTLSQERGCRTGSYTRSQIQQTFAFAGAHTKHQIAVAIVARFPELAPRLPPFRKPWMSEDARMSIFDATALALTFYRKESRKRSANPAVRDPEWAEIVDGITKL